MSAARLPEIRGTFPEIRIARSALLLYILSLEGLSIALLITSFLRQHMISSWKGKRREEKFSPTDKWRLLSLLGTATSVDLDFGCYPWSHVAEFIKVRTIMYIPNTIGRLTTNFWRLASSCTWTGNLSLGMR